MSNSAARASLLALVKSAVGQLGMVFEPEICGDGAYAFSLADGSRLEVTLDKDESGVLLFLSVEPLEEQKGATWREWLSLGMRTCSPFGVFVASDDKNESVYLVKYLDLTGMSSQTLTESIGVLAHVRELISTPVSPGLAAVELGQGA